MAGRVPEHHCMTFISCIFLKLNVLGIIHSSNSEKWFERSGDEFIKHTK